MMPEEISTERLHLRAYRWDDVADVLRYADDQEWAKFLPVPVPYSVRDAEQFLARLTLTNRLQQPSWAITVEKRVVGGINVRFFFDYRVAEIGYSVSRDSWNRGYMTEAARAIVDEAFSCHEQLARVRSHADVRNRASIRVMEKLGMTFEGCLRSDRYIRGELVDDAYYGILRAEWSASRA
jgi:RimJ/RimL family protein N-acetyltransferase